MHPTEFNLVLWFLLGPPNEGKIPMKLATRQFGSVDEVKASLKRGGSNSGTAWVKAIPAEGLVVRFLAEPHEWFGYFEYWDQQASTFVPMAEGEVLPDGVKPSFRYLVNAVDTTSDQVLALKLPKSAANALMLKFDKYGTMLDRDYELDKHGTGLDTTYEVTPAAPAPKALDKYTSHDLEEVLVSARASALGEQVEAAADPDPFDSTDIDDDDDDDVVESSTAADDLSSLPISQLRKMYGMLTNGGDADSFEKDQLVDQLVDLLEE